MNNWFKKLVSLFLTICLLLTSMATMAEEQETQIVDEIVEEVTESLPDAQEEFAIQEDQKQEEPVAQEDQKEPVKEETVKEEEPAQEELAIEENVKEESAQEQHAEESEAAQVAEEPSLEETAEKTVQEEIAEEPAAEEPAAEEPAEEETVVEEIEQDTADIDTTKPVSENIAFVKGYAEILCITAVYKDQYGNEKIAMLEAGYVKVTDRINAGEVGDLVLVCFELKNETVVGYIHAEDVRPCTGEEFEEWLQTGEKLMGSLIEENEIIEIPVESAAIEDATQAETGVDESPETESARDDSVVVEVEQVEIVPEEEVLIEEPVLEESVVENPVTEEPTAEVEELVVDETDEYITLETAYAVDGDVILENGKASQVNIASYANAQNYANFTMNEAGLLTLTFKSVGQAHGNVDLTIKTEENVTVWFKQWATSEGTINFSDFVEPGEYTITVGKSDSTDENSYNLILTPIVSRQGELGVMNKTRTSAAELSIGSTATGIRTVQDVTGTINADFYKFILSQPSWVTLSYTNRTDDKLTFRVFGDDPDNVLYGMSDTINGATDKNENSTTTSNKKILLDAGTYYITVSGSNTGRYNIAVSSSAISITEKEKNDSFITAYNIGNRLDTRGTSINGLLSVSNGVDCYPFHLDKPTIVDIDLKIQFPGVVAGVYTRDGFYVADSSFGKTGTYGGPGNPYELEKRNLRLVAGDYYVRVSWDSSNSTGLYEISMKAKVTASILDVKVQGDVAQINAMSSPSFITPKKSYIHLYIEDSGNLANIENYEYTNRSSVLLNYTIPEKGHYVIQYVVTDGTNWDEIWNDFYYDGKEFEILSIAVNSDENGLMTCSASYSGNGNLKSSNTSLYLSGKLIEQKDLYGATKWTFNAPTSGVYTISFSATLSGTTWKEGWTNYEVKKKEILPLKIENIIVSTDKKGNIHCAITTKNGYQLKSVDYTLHNNGKIIATKHTNSLTTDFTVNKTGTYTLQCVAFDGEVWAEEWKTFNVIVSDYSILAITSLSASVDKDGLISMAASTSGGNKLTESFFEVIYGGSVIKTIKTNNGKATYQALKNGNYTIHYVASDGSTWVEDWYTTSVSVPDLAPYFTSLGATSDTAGAVTITCDYVSKRGLQWLDYNLFTSAGEHIFHQRTKGEKKLTHYVSQSGTYTVQVVLYDGFVWDEKWTTVPVTVTGSGMADVSITALNVTRTSASSLFAEGVLNDERALYLSIMYLHRDGKMIAEKAAPSKTATFTGLSAGNYCVQYVVYDGKKWTEAWQPVVVGTTTLTIDSFTVAKSGNNYTGSVTLTNEISIVSAMMIAYNSSGKEIARWTWSGSGDYMNHVFNLDSSMNVNHFKYVVFDGVQWVEGWADAPH